MEEHSFIVDMSGVNIGPYCGTMSELTRVSSMDDVPGFMNDVPGFTKEQERWENEFRGEGILDDDGKNTPSKSYFTHIYHKIYDYIFGPSHDINVYDDGEDMLAWHWM